MGPVPQNLSRVSNGWRTGGGRVAIDASHHVGAAGTRSSLTPARTSRRGPGFDGHHTRRGMGSGSIRPERRSCLSSGCPSSTCWRPCPASASSTSAAGTHPDPRAGRSMVPEACPHAGCPGRLPRLTRPRPTRHTHSQVDTIRMRRSQTLYRLRYGRASSVSHRSGRSRISPAKGTSEGATISALSSWAAPQTDVPARHGPQQATKQPPPPPPPPPPSVEPWMVISSLALSVPPWPSETVYVKVSLSVCPSFSALTAESLLSSV